MARDLPKLLKRAFAAGKQAYRRELFEQANKGKIHRGPFRQGNVIAKLKQGEFKEVLREASKRSKGSRLKGID
jgi:hypothetical protein